jgi:hypothetical protein
MVFSFQELSSCLTVKSFNLKFTLQTSLQAIIDIAIRPPASPRRLTKLEHHRVSKISRRHPRIRRRPRIRRLQ